MKTAESLTAIMTENRSLYFILRNSLRTAAQKIDEFISCEVIEGDNNPASSAKMLIDEIGKPTAQLVLASIINAKAWDGRISKDNAAWAAGIEDALDEQAVRKIGMNCNAHPTHINSLATAFREI